MPQPGPTPWRLIFSGHLSGAENMAVDEAIFEAVAARQAPPTLRLYGWEPPAVSLGYAQALDERVKRAEICRRGYGLVRRPTGGRAIIHHHEVTYSVCVRLADLSAGRSVMQSYRELSRGVECGLALLGVPAMMPSRQRERSGAAGGAGGHSGEEPAGGRAGGGARGHSGGCAADRGRDLPTVCFARTAGGDMVAEGRKIVGSAQMRRSEAVLQHGSIPLRLDPEEHLALLGGGASAGEGERSALRRAAVGVAEVLGRDVSFEELAGAVARGFSEALGIELTQEALSPAEAVRARELVRLKYATDAWNLTPGRRAEGA